MIDYANIARGLAESLSLSLPPIAVCFTDLVPAGVPSYQGLAPGGCLFWQEAAKGPFATSTADHALCAIGVHTHNLAEPSESQATELGDVLKVMADLNYASQEEAAAIPVLDRQAKHVVYAPLAETPLEPDVVLLFAHSGQSLVITEAIQRLQPNAPPAMGRPACAVIPQAINSGQAALSLGCCGARAYLDALSDDVALWAIPGSRLAAAAEQIEIMAQANETLTNFHQLRRKDVESGARPSVKDSLARLSSH
jgi:uncharacterized protein (DUF169 family)